MRNKKLAFTLIELLMVMVIIGTLTVISLDYFGKAKVKSRDVQRKAHVSSIAQALEHYRSANGVYAPQWCAAVQASISCFRASRTDTTGLGDMYFNTNGGVTNNDPLFTADTVVNPDWSGYLLNLMPKPSVIPNTAPSTLGSFSSTNDPTNATVNWNSGAINYRVQNIYYMVRVLLEDTSAAGSDPAGTCNSTTAGNYITSTSVVDDDAWNNATYSVQGASCGPGVYKIYQVSSLSIPHS